MSGNRFFTFVRQLVRDLFFLGGVILLSVDQLEAEGENSETREKSEETSILIPGMDDLRRKLREKRLSGTKPTDSEVNEIFQCHLFLRFLRSE